MAPLTQFRLDQVPVPGTAASSRYEHVRQVAGVGFTVRRPFSTTLSYQFHPSKICIVRSTSSLITILLVEDSEPDIVLTLRGLERAKLQNRVVTVRDGVEALAFLRREAPYQRAPRPDLVLLDLNLPRLDGREVLRRLREDPRLRDLPVVVLTVSDSDQERVAVGAADAFMTKPVDFEQLAKIVGMIADFGWSIVKLSRLSSQEK